MQAWYIDLVFSSKGGRQLTEKVIIIGLDGADWSIINHLLSENKLPTFKKIMDNGASGRLKSTLPTSSPPAWASFLTGKNPGKHGIFDFLRFDKNKNEIFVTTYIDSK